MIRAIRIAPFPLPRILLALFLAALLSACGGGGGSSSGNPVGGMTPSPTPGSPPAPVTLTNFTTVTVDSGPAELAAGPGAYSATNLPYVTVTICAPGSTSNCQTIDHVLLDTGSVGLRLLQPVLASGLLSALPTETAPSGNPVGECYGFVDGYVFGSVRQADFQIGGEHVSSMPLQIIGDTGAFATVPASCSSGGGTELNTVKLLGANGVIGLGIGATDCGVYCTISGSSGAASYYDCPSSGCSSLIARSASTQAPFQQLPNPVAAFPTDNNGTILSLPSVAATGAPSISGTLYFGISTSTNNGLGSASVITTDANGDFTTDYNGKSLNRSFIDSGSNYYYFADSSIIACTGSGFSGFYCPTSPLLLSPNLLGTNGKAASGAFTLYNAETQPATSSNVEPGIGANPNNLSFPNPVQNSFDFGLPFFLGRNVFTAIEGRNAGGTAGPYFAF